MAVSSWSIERLVRFINGFLTSPIFKSSILGILAQDYGNGSSSEPEWILNALSVAWRLRSGYQIFEFSRNLRLMNGKDEKL